jgi:hypothetical protein
VQILQYIGVAIGVVVFLAGAVVFLRGSADKGTMESQGRQIVALENELAIEKGRTARLEAQVKVCEAKIEGLSLLKSHSAEIQALQTTAGAIKDDTTAILKAVAS